MLFQPTPVLLVDICWDFPVYVGLNGVNSLRSVFHSK